MPIYFVFVIKRLIIILVYKFNIPNIQICSG